MISVIIPVYNVEKYLKNCIESVVSQSYTDLEILLINDGSTDSSGEICEEYKSKDSRIQVIHKENGGLSSARNAGLDVCSGDYIFFLDSDDTLVDDALLLLYNAIIESNCDAVFAGYNAVDENENFIHQFLPVEEILEGDRRFNVVYEQLPLVMTCTKLFCRKIFHNFRFKLNKLHEDVFAYHEIAHRTNQIYCLNIPVINYTQRMESITGKKFSLQNFDAVDALFERVSFFESNGLKNCAVQTVKFIYKYLIYIIHRIDFTNVELTKILMQYYNSWKKLSGKNKDLEFYAIVYLYKTNLIKKAFTTSGCFRILKYLKKIVSARNIIRKLIFANLHIKPNYILISTPVHGNLGDQAIVYAQKKLLKDCGIKHILEFQSVEYLAHASVFSKFCRKKDVIIIDGGGNIGTLWPTESARIKKIITSFPNNQIIIFPESAFFSNDFKGLLEMKAIKSIYEKHYNLSVFMRDIPSYNIMKELLPNSNIFLCPDIVLYLKNRLSFQNVDRCGVALCMRKDSEKITNNSLILEIENYLKVRHIQTVILDTVIGQYVTEESRENALFSLWNKISQKKLIITDRLHGMIFAYITNTPCIALNNISKKIEHQYQWINNFDNIVFTPNEKDIIPLLEKFVDADVEFYVDLDEKFKELENIVYERSAQRKMEI